MEKYNQRGELYINDIKSKGSIIKEKGLQTEKIKLSVSPLIYNNFC